jgi:acetoin utilization protein AcuC
MKHRIGAFVHSNEIERFHYPADCSYKTERAGLTRQLLRANDLFNGSGNREVAPRPATDKEFLLFHSRDYITALRRVEKGDFRAKDMTWNLGTPETPVFSGMFGYAELATGGTLVGAEMIVHGNADYVFNPSGGFHHALPAAAGSFCYVNDVVIACALLRSFNKRVFCLDLDAQQGNAAQAAYYGSRDVFTMSIHESGKSLFPWGGFEDEIGEGKGFGYNVNIPLPAGADDRCFEAAFREIALPCIGSYKPDVIVLVIGMNGLAGDPTAHLSMSNNTIADALVALVKSKIPLLVLGGGGADPQRTARGWALAWTVLCGMEGEVDKARDLRDPHSAAGAETILSQVTSSIRQLKQTVFPIHGIL